MSDETLLEQFLLGDDAAYTQLYERFDASVLTYLRTILKDNLDIADDRAFVTGIRGLDPAARRASVPVLSGASSVPCLSGAVA